MVNVSVFKTCLKILLLVTLTYWSFGGDEQTELGIIKIWSSNFVGVCVSVCVCKQASDFESR